jgi:periplasmic protein TonB
VTEANAMAAATIEQPWTRLGWIIPSALLLWLATLTVFGLLLERTAPPPPELAPTQVQIVELPPPAGLQGGSAAAPAAAKPKMMPVKPHVRIERRVIPHPKVHHIVKARPEPVAPSINGTAKSEEEKVPAASAPAATTAKESSGNGSVPSGSGSGSGIGAGSDSGGARAIFAPKPVIPDDLRERIMAAVAVAHFKVSYNGQVEVRLTTPTNNPELNEILLDTLKQWRFFPAMKGGVAINSEFDVRIPVRVE